MNLDNLISSQFELDKFSTDKERIKALQEKINDMQEVINSMYSLQERFRQSIFEDWKRKTKEMFPDLHPCERGALTDVSVILDGKKTDIFIQEENNGKLYCQIEFSTELDDEERYIEGTKIQTLSDILPKPQNGTCLFKYIEPHEYDEVFQLFVDVVNRCKQLANNG